MYENRFYSLDAAGRLRYRLAGEEEAIELDLPRFHIDGRGTGAPGPMVERGAKDLGGGFTLLSWEGAYPCGARLTLEARVCENTPFVRFRYILSGDKDMRFTKPGGRESLTYFSYSSPPGAERTEVRLSDYDYRLHSYCLSELPAFRSEPDAMGPILAEGRDGYAMLTAYEHGSQYPDKFLAFFPDGGGVSLKAVKGNTWQGQHIFPAPYETIWLQIGAVKGNVDDLARAYREFQLKYCSPNRESRKPYIFYNTWAFQERNKFYNGAAYLDSMNFDRICREIDAAHEMGIEVFVIDTGWYKKTGDWEVDLERFPDGLKEVKRRLDSYGMKLGLWFNPTVAAVTSRLLKEHRDTVAEMHGREAAPFPIWETEESYPMCIVSEAWEAFAGQLVRLYKELGVTYFKWDAVNLYGCESAGHLHGGPESGAQENGGCYAFQIGRYLSKIVDRLCEECPEAIVDMDITECCRYFGLGFLSSGKFFAVNNGPYFQDYDIEPPKDVWINAFVHPGPARPRICRGVLGYDKWIPSVLMMTHYLPDGPESSQLINLATLILGQNGIWGDLPAISPEGRALFRRVLDAYKQVRDDITAASPVTLGHPGSTFEVYEKISASGRGVVSLFGSAPGIYRFRLASRPAGDPLCFGPARLVKEQDGLCIEADFSTPGAAMVFFGAAAGSN